MRYMPLTEAQFLDTCRRLFHRHMEKDRTDPLPTTATLISCGMAAVGVLSFTQDPTRMIAFQAEIAARRALGDRVDDIEMPDVPPPRTNN